MLKYKENALNPHSGVWTWHLITYLDHIFLPIDNACVTRDYSLSRRL